MRRGAEGTKKGPKTREKEKQMMRRCFVGHGESMLSPLIFVLMFVLPRLPQRVFSFFFFYLAGS